MYEIQTYIELVSTNHGSNHVGRVVVALGVVTLREKHFFQQVYKFKFVLYEQNKYGVCIGYWIY
jgi:hypothetical protein